jgi:polysaccharide pyruvyl transferase WcaK-like protein
MDVKRILIIGYYGSGNAGDEALLRAAVNLLNKVYTKPDITAITYSVKDTEKTHGIKGISRNKYMDIVQGIINSDILVGGGGSMLQNVTSIRLMSGMYFSFCTFAGIGRAWFLWVLSVRGNRSTFFARSREYVNIIVLALKRQRKSL